MVFCKSEQTKDLDDMENKLCRASLTCKLIMNNGNDPPARPHYSMGKLLMRNLRSPNWGLMKVAECPEAPAGLA